MDNLPKKENQADKDSSQASGEIYSHGEQSVYGEATRPENHQEADGQYQGIQPPFSEGSSSNSTSNDSNSGYSQEGSVNASPYDAAPNSSSPFEENKQKKIIIYIVAVIIFLLLILLGYFVFNFIKNRQNNNSPKDNKTKVVLNYWGLWEDDQIMKGVVDDYQRIHPNVEIKYAKQSTVQYRERLQAAIDRSEGPDIFRFHNSWVPMIVNQLDAMPKDIYSDEEFENTFYPVASSDLKMGGNYYGIPLEIDGLLLFYNEDILKSANVQVPSTWIDVQNVAFQNKLTVIENNKLITSAIALGTTDNIDHFSDILGLMFLQNGTKLNKSLFSCLDEKITSCSVEVLTFYHKFAEPGTPNYTWNETIDNSIIAFATGKVAMILAPSWQTFTIQEIAKNSNTQLNFKTAQVPQLPCNTSSCPPINWATYWVEGVAKTSKNKKAAWEFLKYLSSKEVMIKLYSEQMKVRQLFGEPYSRKDLADKLSDNHYLAPLIAAAPTMKSFYLVSRTYDGDTGIDSRMITYLKNAVNSLNQGVSPESALKTADEGFKQVYSSFGITSAN